MKWVHTVTGRGLSGGPAGGQRAQRAHRAVGILGQRLEQGQRAARIVDPGALLEAEPGHPPDRGALERGGGVARHEDADLERVIEVDARELGGGGVDQRQPAEIEGAPEGRVGAAIARHANVCSPMLRADASAPRRRVGLTTAVAASKIARVGSTEQVLVQWPAASLHSREAAALRVRVGGNRAWSEWSAPATVEAGLLRAEDWTAGFVSPSELGATGALAPVLGATLRVPGAVPRARLYATAHGGLGGSAGGQSRLIAPLNPPRARRRPPRPPRAAAGGRARSGCAAG